MASEEDIERIARQLCIAAGKDPDRITALTFMPPHPREWMQFRGVAREALLVAAREWPLALWQPITNAPQNEGDQPPENKGDHPYIVSEGTYVEKALWNKKAGWYRNGDRDAVPLEPQPTHWLSEGDLLRLIPAPKT
jgi:hypothetical protein